MVNTYHKQKGHKFLTNLTNSEYLAFLYSDHTKKSTDTDEASNTAETKTKECKIELSDNGILVDGETISENTEDSVYAGADIIYYKEGQDSTYGAGDEDDGHSEEEAAEHTVITITKAGTYRVSGTLSKGQIAIDLGEDSRDDGSDDTETETKDVDITNAGVRIILADDSENTVTGSHVAKIYKEGTTQEDVDAGNSDNEEIETYLHLTVNAGAGQEGGTPFTQVGVRELRRLGILTMVIPTGCAVGAEVVQGILTGFINL